MRKGLYLLVLAILVVSLSSCATFKKKPSKLDELTTRVTNLESRIDKIEGQRSIVIPLPGQKAEPAATEAPIQKPAAEKPLTLKEIQAALKKAGFYTGAVDGKIGPQTEKAIKDFQKANDLKVDGIIGARTSKLLRNYLK